MQLTDVDLDSPTGGDRGRRAIRRGGDRHVRGIRESGQLGRSGQVLHPDEVPLTRLALFGR